MKGEKYKYISGDIKVKPASPKELRIRHSVRLTTDSHTRNTPMFHRYKAPPK